MKTKRQLFLEHVAQTSTMPLMLEIDYAQGMFIVDKKGKQFLDMNSGINVSSLGHCHPAVLNAIQDQSNRYLHTMVYGEHVQNPQVDYASLLTSHLPADLNSVYFVTSGSEAIEGAMKLAKRVTGRYEIISFENAYHGSTQGAESLRSDESFKRKYRPFLPGIRHLKFNDFAQLDQISTKTACVVCEPIQGEAGVLVPEPGFLKALRNRCDDTDTLLIFDEIQTGFGRTGSLFAFQQFNIRPDILAIGKAMGGGMPIAAFISSKKRMDSFTKQPALGHITTFGGHPVCCAAAHAMLKTLLEEKLIDGVSRKGKLFKELLQHPIVKEVRGAGLMMAVELTKKRYMKFVVSGCIERGLLVDWFLFNNKAFRLAPPLIVSDDDIKRACSIIIESLDSAMER